jgi:hypothetical protein
MGNILHSSLGHSSCSWGIVHSLNAELSMATDECSCKCGVFRFLVSFLSSDTLYRIRRLRLFVHAAFVLKQMCIESDGFFR